MEDGIRVCGRRYQWLCHKHKQGAKGGDGATGAGAGAGGATIALVSVLFAVDGVGDHPTAPTLAPIPAAAVRQWCVSVARYSSKQARDPRLPASSSSFPAYALVVVVWWEWW